MLQCTEVKKQEQQVGNDKQIKLREFVRDTLVQLAQAINDANEELVEIGGLANPRLQSSDSGSAVRTIEGKLVAINVIEFDLAVEAATGSGSSGRVGVMSTIIGVGMEGRSDYTAATTSRVKFSVPLVLPSKQI